VLAYLNAPLIFWDSLHPTATDGRDLDTTQAGKRWAGPHDAAEKLGI
jgi:hypothetical protein